MPQSLRTQSAGFERKSDLLDFIFDFLFSTTTNHTISTGITTFNLNLNGVEDHEKSWFQRQTRGKPWGRTSKEISFASNEKII